MALVSCLCPTYNRRRFLPRAIDLFLAQDYPERELIILDDGTDPVGDLIPNDPRIRYERRDEQMTIGPKRHECVRLARGDFFANWDDDDWHAPARLSVQMAALRQSGKDACLLDPVLFFEEATGETWRWSRRGAYIIASLIWTRSFYEKYGPFPPSGRSADQHILRVAPYQERVYVDGGLLYIAVRHDHNNATCRYTGDGWARSTTSALELMGKLPT